jgi:hypothetical protein
MSDRLTFQVALDTPLQQRADREATHLEISVYYRKGGISYSDYKTYPSGIYLSVGPITIKDGFESFMMFSAKGRKIEDATRLNRKRVAAVFESVRADYENKRGIVWEMANQVLGTNQPTLIPEEEPHAQVEATQN